jgi:membrane protein implicated in regulation of membrane protease activity
VLLAAAIVGLFVLPSPWNVVGVCVAAVIEVGELYAWKRFLDRYRVRGGAEGMIGERAEVIEACDPAGRVKLRGEIWAARAEAGEAFAVGERVRVIAVDGLQLRLGRGDP